jgi:hypothetical protein
LGSDFISLIQRRRQRFGSLSVHVCNDNPRAGLSQDTAKFCPQQSRSAGDDGNATAEVEKVR